MSSGWNQGCVEPTTQDEWMRFMRWIEDRLQTKSKFNNDNILLKGNLYYILRHIGIFID